MTKLKADTGNYYYGARYYDPKMSIWLSVDPMAAKRTWLTPYNFVQNNPLLRVDPDGNLDSCTTCPNGPQFDVYRNSPVNYEFTPNGNGGGEIHLSNHQSLQEVEVGPGRINSTEAVISTNVIQEIKPASNPNSDILASTLVLTAGTLEVPPVAAAVLLAGLTYYLLHRSIEGNSSFPGPWYTERPIDRTVDLVNPKLPVLAVVEVKDQNGYNGWQEVGLPQVYYMQKRNIVNLKKSN